MFSPRSHAVGVGRDVAPAVAILMVAAGFRQSVGGINKLKLSFSSINIFVEIIDFFGYLVKSSALINALDIKLVGQGAVTIVSRVGLVVIPPRDTVWHEIFVAIRPRVKADDEVKPSDFYNFYVVPILGGNVPVLGVL